MDNIGKKPEIQEVNNIKETTKILGISRNTLNNLIYAEKLKAVKAGKRRLLIPGWAILEFLGQKQTQL